MNTVLVAALVAGIVSLAGVLANLYIARQARRTTLLQMKLQILASNASKSNELFKTFITEAERVRICCWSLLGHLVQVRRGAGSIEFDQIRDDCSALRESLEAYFQGARKFEESWATVKGEVPSGVELYIRASRHDCLHLVNDAGLEVQRLLRTLEKNNEQDEIYSSVRHSEESLHRLLAGLDQLISLTKSIIETEFNDRLLNA